MTPRELDPDAGEEVPEGMPQRVDDMLAWVVDRRRASQGQANTKPGATAFTFTPMRPTSLASDFVKPTNDALVAAYTERPL